MLTITQIHYIRKLYYDKGKTISEIVKATGHNHRTVKKYVEQEDFNNPPVKVTHLSKSDLIRPFVRQILNKDKTQKKKHRHTAKSIYERALKEEPNLCQIASRTMRNLVKEEREKLYNDKECYLDLDHPGGEAQVDFGEIYIEENGQVIKTHELVLSFPKSNAGFCQITRSETMEALQEGLQNIFRHMGHIPNKIWFDQMAAACIRSKDIHGNAIPTKNFLKFATHYGFETVFCNPNSGNEKGNVENKVGYFRNNIFIPFIKVDDLKESNKQILSLCDKDNLRIHYKHREPIIDILNDEKSLMLPVNLHSYDCAKYEKRRVTKLGHISFGNNSYSVSPKHVGEYIWIKIMANELAILDKDFKEITRHKRSFEKNKTFTHWIDFCEIVLSRPKALKYSGFYQILPSNWSDYTTSLEIDNLKLALRFLKFCLLNDNLAFAETVLANNIKDNISDPNALWTTYYRLKENRGTYCQTSDGIKVPHMPDYSISLSDYDELMGGGNHG